MITDTDRRHFEALFKEIELRLQQLGFGTLPYRPDANEEDTLWAKLFSWGNKITITIWYGGDWFEDKKKRFWVGFQGSKSQLHKLRDLIKEANIMDDPLDCNNNTVWNVITVSNNNGFVFEYDDSCYYIGLYFMSEDDEIPDRAAEFVDNVLQSVEPLQDISNLKTRAGRSRLGPTRCEALISARRGQGRFRRDLEAIWEGRCAVTGCAARAVLRASHIKPWRDANDDERLDGENGLLLSANIDALFDRGLVNFNDEGSIIIGKAVSSTDRKLLMLDGMKLSKPPSEKQRLLLRSRDRALSGQTARDEI